MHVLNEYIIYHSNLRCIIAQLNNTLDLSISSKIAITGPSMRDGYQELSGAQLFLEVDFLANAQENEKHKML